MYNVNKGGFIKMNVNQRIEALRKLMTEKNIDVYYIPNEDDHLSEEYTADYFKCKSFMSGFSGESGCTIVTRDFAGLWTDGRFFTQAENELKGTCVTLMRMGQPNVMDPIEFLIQNTPANGTLGFDGSVVSATNAQYLTKKLSKKNASIHVKDDLVQLIWKDERPAMPMEKLFVLAKKFTGESAEVRIERVRQAMKSAGADVLLLTRLEDPCWMLNVRGGDIESTPVSYAFAMVTSRKVVYYVDEKKVTPAVKKHFDSNGVTVRSYQSLAKDVKSIKNKTIWADLRTLNAKLYDVIDSSNQLLNQASPIVMFRALKNKTEIKNIRIAHEKDAVAVIKFIRWVKESIQTTDLDEVKAQDYLYALRAESENYIEPSFGTISAYKANAAMMHYSATEEKHAKLKPESFLLVDSGGTYMEGTTDITRTIALGPLTTEEKKLYTLVLKGHLALSRAKFLYGTTGNNLDILARGPLWNIDIDYQCGTGHGVGHVLAVHEGPHSIRWGMGSPARPAQRLEEGMVVTNEPGVYIAHKLGIRIENELLVTKGKKNFYGQFMEFETLTYVPYELDAIDTAYLDEADIQQINEYHAMIYRLIGPKLKGKDKSWLKNATRKITK